MNIKRRNKENEKQKLVIFFKADVALFANLNIDVATSIADISAFHLIF